MARQSAAAPSPQMRKSDLTRHKILTAAEAEFSEIGLYGARVDSIAERAGVNKRMIYAHFGNKEQLYITVLTTVYNRMAEADEDLLSSDLSAADMVRRIIAMYFDFLTANPTFVRMLMWENLNSAAYLRASGAGLSKGRSLKMLSDALLRGIENGTFRSDLDVENAVLSINMFCFSYFSNIHTMSHLLQRDLTEPAAVARYADYVTDMVLQYLTHVQEDL